MGNIKIEKEKAPIFWDIKKLLVSGKISFGEKTINTLMVTCSIIRKISLYKSSKKLLFSLLISIILWILQNLF